MMLKDQIISKQYWIISLDLAYQEYVIKFFLKQEKSTKITKWRIRCKINILLNIY